ncbi:MAG: hypothetical protein A3F72_20455 [Bacteroidetes bacterium RIFCSPLOWO2_12_FULL_35_15]|nr:MAG: hypothetical protein A3F72_20455 [Bacteroidetes bacterium RIFCSPLOWO2_12_FULL_35_15]
MIYQFFFAEGVTVTQNVPSSAKAESEFTIEVTINKGAVGGFAKLQQELPEGFTAIEDKNSGASFTFSNHAVKFIWMSLPGENEIKVSYKVKVAANDVNGDKIIAGKFSYISENIKQIAEIPPATITITGGGSSQAVVTTTTPDTTTTTNTVTTTTTDNTTKTPTQTNPETSPFSCSRNVQESGANEYVIEITINKGNLSGFAKLVETLPAGYTATALESKEAAFTFADQKVKYVWVSMPSAPEFKVSYKIKVAENVTGAQTIDGVFSYIENDETKKFIVPTSTIGTGTQPLVTNTTDNTTTDNTTKTTDVVDNTTKTTTDNTVKTTDVVDNTTKTTTDNTVKTTDVVDNTTKTTTTTDNTTTDNSTKSLSATTIPAPQGKIKYSVQIAALHNAKNPNVLATMFNINEQINTEMAEGFTKYTIGSHGEYKSARDARETIKNKGVVGPFVTAYNTGKRITVQEALMITSQKWYK